VLVGGINCVRYVTVTQYVAQKQYHLKQYSSIDNFTAKTVRVKMPLNEILQY